MAVDKFTLRDHLEKARRHVAEGERHITHQRDLIAELERGGHYSLLHEARKMLQQFENVQRSHIQGRDLLEKELAESHAKT